MIQMNSIKVISIFQLVWIKPSGETHLNSDTEKTLHDGVYLFPTD